MMHRTAGHRHRRQPGRLVQLAVIPHHHAARPGHPLRPVPRRYYVLARLHAIPLAQMQRRPMHHIAIVGRKAHRRAHREAAHNHKRHVLRRPIDVIVQEARRKTARNERRIVRVQDRREHRLLEPLIVVAAQRFDFRPHAGRIR